jgi:pilus assembly protein Flp/PilA
MNIFSSLMKDENGATAIEYGLIAALISIAAILAMTFLGKNVSNTFNTVGNQLGASVAAAPAAR